MASDESAAFPEATAETPPRKRPHLEGKENTPAETAGDKLLTHEDRIRHILSRPFRVPLANFDGGVARTKSLGVRRVARARGPLHDPEVEDAIVLYNPPPLTAEQATRADLRRRHPVHVVVDPVLGRCLRPHQIEGVKFLFDCVMGFRLPGHHGCIMADEMGLGKTFQCVALMWTLLRQSPSCTPAVSRVVVVTPSSLVKNWANEVNKWLKGRLGSMPIDGGTSEEIDQNIERFFCGRTSPVMVISYETLRTHIEAMRKGQIGLIICDEGHRLKNSENQTYMALNSLNVERRIILSGTPIQNDLLEYYSLVSFCNPRLLGDAAMFRKHFEGPILKSRDADCTDKEKELGTERLQELLKLVNACIIRRTNDLLSKYLPAKVEQIVCCRLTPFQKQIYQSLIHSKAVQRAVQGKAKGGKKSDGGGTVSTLALISTMKKLCNHPKLICDDSMATSLLGAADSAALRKLARKSVQPELSGKLALLDEMLARIRQTTDDKVVLVSNYTQTLSMFEELCGMRGYRFCRLDGSMTVKRRQKIVDQFNDPQSDLFVFMLSSKAGGCGLNLIGANRLVMFDIDWNPANDEQAMARIWRDGQRKKCFVYRMVATGSIEEKILQRQAHKKALSNCVVDEAEDVARHFSLQDLQDLFTLNETTTSDTHDRLKCLNCRFRKIPTEMTAISPDLKDWQHQRKPLAFKDPLLREDNGRTISFVFRAETAACQVTEGPDDKDADED